MNRLERMKGADMITPIGTLNINQIAERKDDLLVSSEDIKALARNERNKAIDEFVEELRGSAFYIRLFGHENGNFVTTTECIDRLAEQLKGGAV